MRSHMSRFVFLLLNANICGIFVVCFALMSSREYEMTWSVENRCLLFISAVPSPSRAGQSVSVGRGQPGLRCRVIAETGVLRIAPEH